MPTELENTSTPLVSVVVPVFNAGAAVRGGMDAVLGQTYPNLEIIVVDDGSEDDSVTHVLKSIGQDARARLLQLKANLGPAGARNTGLREAAGDFVWFVDWDDQWEPDFVERMVDAAVRHRADVVVCRGSWRLADGRDVGTTDGSAKFTELNGEQAFDLLLSGMLKGYLWNKLFRREVMPVDPFPHMRTQEDICALATMLPRCDKVILLREVLYHHVKRAGSLTNTANPPLENLRIARDVMHQNAGRLVASKDRDRLLLHYDVAYWHLATIGTALRLGGEDSANEAIAGFQRDITLSKALQVSTVSMSTSARAVAVKSLGRNYRRIRTAFVSARDFARARTTIVRSLQPMNGEHSRGLSRKEV